MRSPVPVLAVALALVVLAALGYAVLSGEPPAIPAPGASLPARPAAPEVTDSADVAVPDLAEDRIEVGLSTAAPRTDGKEGANACVVLGRIVDERDLPVPGATVRLAAWKVWAEGADAPRLEGPNDYRGYEVETDLGGAFRIAAPVPTAERTWLTIEPDPYRDSVRVNFETGGRRAEPSLTAGVRDLGVLRLATTGAIRGRVTDGSGQPLPDVYLNAGPGPSTTYGRDARTAADGTYLIAHAPVGSYGVSAKAEGYLSQFRQPVVVEAARDTLGIDFELAKAPTIEGIVTDRAGRPLEGARLWGWPGSIGAGSGAGARSDAQGRFVVALPQDEPYTLGAKLDGYGSWGDEDDRSVTYPPGTRDLEIALEALPRTRFEVVDAETGEPVEHFGIAILPDGGSRAPRRVATRLRPPRQEERAGGVALVPARPGIDSYLVVAVGYVDAEGDVEHESPDTPEAPDSPRQVVPLRRGGRLVGRVLRDGEPLAATTVEAERGGTRLLADTDTGEPGPLRFQASGDPARSTATGTDGRFELVALEGGTYRLTVHPERGAPLVVVPLEVADRGTTDAGDLTVVPGAAVDGRVLVPAGIASGGLRVWLDDWRDGVSAVTDDGGAFRFEDLPPGAHDLTLGDRPGELAHGATASVELTSGETASATIDARDRATCPVTLVIQIDGGPAAGRQVDLVSMEDPRERAVLGKCDEAGRVSGFPRAWGEARVVLHIGWRGLEHPTARLRLEPGSPVDEVVRYELASVTVALPSGVAPPDSGAAVLILRARDGGYEQTVRLAFRDGRPDASAAEVARAEPGSLWFGLLPAGAFELTLELVDDAAEPQLVSLGGGEFRIERPPFWRVSRPVDLRAGEDLRVVLE